MKLKPKVAVIFTGGTISMSIDKRIGAAIPSLSGEQIMSLVTNIDRYADIETNNFCKCPGPHITPELMLELKNLIEEYIKREDITGVVLLQGTDTLEETAYFLDLSIDTYKPIILTGAMRNSSELGYDGPSNLSSAVCTAISPESRDRGVLVVLNNEVNSAREVTKTSTMSLDTFKSLKFGPLGIVDNDEVIYYRTQIKKDHIEIKNIDKRVDLIKAVAGMDGGVIDYCVENGCDGIVIEGMGRGNVPPNILINIKKAINSGVIVALTSRCHTGRIYASYGYEGGGKTLKDLGVIFSDGMPGQKLRIKLMLALSNTNDYNKIKEIISSY